MVLMVRCAKQVAVTWGQALDKGLGHAQPRNASCVAWSYQRVAESVQSPQLLSQNFRNCELQVGHWSRRSWAVPPLVCVAQWAQIDDLIPGNGASRIFPKPAEPQHMRGALQGQPGDPTYIGKSKRVATHLFAGVGAIPPHITMADGSVGPHGGRGRAVAIFAHL